MSSAQGVTQPMGNMRHIWFGCWIADKSSEHLSASSKSKRTPFARASCPQTCTRKLTLCWCRRTCNPSAGNLESRHESRESLFLCMVCSPRRKRQAGLLDADPSDPSGLGAVSVCFMPRACTLSCPEGVRSGQVNSVVAVSHVEYSRSVGDMEKRRHCRLCNGPLMANIFRLDRRSSWNHGSSNCSWTST